MAQTEKEDVRIYKYDSTTTSYLVVAEKCEDSDKYRIKRVEQHENNEWHYHQIGSTNYMDIRDKTIIDIVTKNLSYDKRNEFYNSLEFDVIRSLSKKVYQLTVDKSDRNITVYIDAFDGIIGTREITRDSFGNPEYKFYAEGTHDFVKSLRDFCFALAPSKRLYGEFLSYLGPTMKFKYFEAQWLPK